MVRQFYAYMYFNLYFTKIQIEKNKQQLKIFQAKANLVLP